MIFGVFSQSPISISLITWHHFDLQSNNHHSHSQLIITRKLRFPNPQGKKKTKKMRFKNKGLRSNPKNLAERVRDSIRPRQLVLSRFCQLASIHVDSRRRGSKPTVARRCFWIAKRIYCIHFPGIAPVISKRAGPRCPKYASTNLSSGICARRQAFHQTLESVANRMPFL